MIQIEVHRRMSKKEFIDMIDKVYPDDVEIDVNIMNFSKGQKVATKKMCNKMEVTVIANESKTIIYSGNQFISHVDLHSVTQQDIKNIKKEGIMKTILFPQLE